METKVVGLTFRIKENPEVAKLRPTNIELKHEDNPHDPNAVAVYAEGIKVGYLPRGIEQSRVNKAWAMGYEVEATVKEYRYRDGEEWNDEHRGELGCIKLELHSKEVSDKREIKYVCSLCGADCVRSNYDAYCPNYKDDKHKVGGKRMWEKVEKGWYQEQIKSNEFTKLTGMPF